MALFKILRGKSQTLPATKTDGWAYFCTDDGGFYIDYTDDKGVLSRKYINQNLWEALGLTLQTIENNIDTIEIDINSIKKEIKPLTDAEIDDMWKDTPGTGETPAFTMTNDFVPVWNGTTFKDGIALKDIATEAEMINFGYDTYAAGSKVVIKRNGYYMCYCNNAKLNIYEPALDSETSDQPVFGDSNTQNAKNARQIVLMAAPYITKPEATTYRGCGLVWYSGTSAFTASIDGFRTSLREGSYMTADEEFYICQMTKGELATLKPVKILLIGNSHSADTFMPLSEVFHAEGHTNYVFGLCKKEGSSIQDHTNNILNNTADYIYYESTSASTESYTTPFGRDDIDNDFVRVTMKKVLEQHQWDYIFIQNSPLDMTDETVFATERNQIVDYIKQFHPEAKIGYACPWLAPYADDKTKLQNLTVAQQTWYDALVAKGGETAVGQYGAMYDAIKNNIMTDDACSMVFAACASVYYANQVLNTSSDVLYRDVLHVSKGLGRLLVAYTFYAQFMQNFSNLETFNEIQLKEYVLGSYRLTAGDKDMILQSVNYTLSNLWAGPGGSV